MKILIVANGYPPTAYGGVEVYVYQLANYLNSHGHAVTVFCRESSMEMPDHETLEETIDGVRIVRIVNDFKGTSSFTDTFQDIRIEEAFTNLIQRLSPEIIHYNHLIALSYRLPVLGHGSGIPSVISLHDYWPFCFRVRLVDWRKQQCAGPLNGGNCYRCIQGGDGNLRNRVLRFIKDALPYTWRQTIRKKFLKRSATSFLTNLSRELIDQRYRLFRESILIANKILTPSQFVRQLYITNGYPAERIEVLKLGVEYPSNEVSQRLARRTGLHTQPLRFVFIGTLIPDKGIDILIRAFKKLEKDYVRLQIYGRDDIAPVEYRNLLKRLSAGDGRINFLGSFDQGERASVYLGADAIIIPSRAPETFSIVAHEALAFGVPVIASGIGALPEVVKHGKNGYLVKPGDVISLYKILEQITAEPNSLDGLEIPGSIEIYSIAEHGKRIENIYLDTIRKMQ